MKKAILVTGSHRSGTTWVGKTISQAPDVAYLNEPFSPLTYQHYRGRCGARFTYWNTYITHDNEADYYPHLRNTIDFRYNLLGQIQASQNLADLKRAIKEQIEFLNHRRQHHIPLVKDPLAILSSEWLAKRFDMNVLVLVRHPAAFCHSIKRLGWAYNFQELLQQPLLVRDYLSPFEEEIGKHLTPDTNIIERGCLIWRIINSVVLQFKERNPDWLFQRYEDVASEPIETFKLIFEHLDLDFSPAVETYIAEYTSSSNTNALEDKDWTYGKRNSRDNIGGWKSYFSPEEALLIRNLVEDVSCHFYSDRDW